MHFFHMLLSVPSRYVSNIDKLIDEAPSDPTQDFKTQVWVSSPVVWLFSMTGSCITIWKTVPQWYDRKSRAVFTKLLQIPKCFLLHASSPVVQFSHIWIQTPFLLSFVVLKMLPSCTVDERNRPHKYTQATLIVCRLSATKLITDSFSCMSVFKCDFYSLCGLSSWIKMLYWYQQGLDIYTSSTLVHVLYSNLKLELSCDSFRQM